MDSILAKGKQLAIKERDKIITQTKPTKNKDDPVDGLIRVTASLVGFASEAHQYRKEKAQSSKKSLRKGSIKSSDNLQCDDKIHTNQVEPGTLQKNDPENTRTSSETEVESRKAKKPSKEPREVAKTFVQKYPRLVDPESKNKIDLPVVLPQRHPNKRSRGFVRAYPPVLAGVHITQEMFLDFIDTFNKILEPNPWLNGINVVGLAANAIPDPVLNTLIGLALDTATEAAMEANSRSRSNTFLNFMNKDFFLPRGLVCFVAIWDPDATTDQELATTVDYNGNVVEKGSYGSQMSDIINKKKSVNEAMKDFQTRLDTSIKPSSGTFEWLEPSAPLVFPTAEETASVLRLRPDGKPKNAFDRGEVWLDRFLDNRSQAKWIEENPTAPGASKLQTQEFRSKYADPNHAASTGDPVAFVTGGKWSLIDKRKEKEERRAEEKKIKEEQKEEERKLAEEKERIKKEKKALEKEERRAKEAAEMIAKEEAREAKLQKEMEKKRAKEEAKMKEKGKFDDKTDQNEVLPRKTSSEPAPVPVDAGKASGDLMKLPDLKSSKEEKIGPDNNKPTNATEAKDKDDEAIPSDAAKQSEVKKEKKEKEKEPPSSISGLLKKNVLYLVIVNVPPNINNPETLGIQQATQPDPAVQ